MTFERKRNDMIVLAQNFNDAFSHNLANLDTDTQFQIKRFATIIVLEKPTSILFSKENLSRLVLDVFQNSVHRDFIIGLTSSFIIRTGFVDEEMANLNRVLANAVSLQSTNSNQCVIPDPVVATSLSNKEILELFNSNKWLVIIALIHLFTAVAKER